MNISSISLFQFRNYSKTKLDLSEKGAVFFGGNGAGKTNMLEAIHLLSVGKSQRTVKNNDLINKDFNEARLEADFFSGSNLPVEVAMTLSRNKAN